MQITKDRRGCYLFEIEDKPQIVEIKKEDGFFFNTTFTNDKRIREHTYKMLKQAKKLLPENYNFMIYEAFRPMKEQVKLWDKIQAKIKKENPTLDTDSKEFIEMCDEFVANPYDRGSGHQTGSSVDLTLCDKNGLEYDMGTKIREFSELSKTNAKNLTEEQRKNREILKTTLEKVGFVNYESEWWHYSFGDFLWAETINSNIAIFGKLNI